jgi:hypothetical protein
VLRVKTNFFLFIFLFFLGNGITNIWATNARLKFSHIKADGEIINWGYLKILNSKSYEKLNSDGFPDKVILQFPFKHLTIAFGMSDSSVGKFRYKLVDHTIQQESDWSKVKKIKSVTYTKLKSRRYSFVLQSINEHGIDEEKTFNFEIEDDLTFNPFSSLIAVSFFSSLIYIAIKFTNTNFKS